MVVGQTKEDLPFAASNREPTQSKGFEFCKISLAGVMMWRERHRSVVGKLGIAFVQWHHHRARQLTSATSPLQRAFVWQRGLSMPKKKQNTNTES
jgi:hypothetical protein